MAESQKLKLYYFGLRARAEPIRMLLSCTDIKYENIVVKFDQWPAMKEAREICPFGQLPVLQLPGGEMISQLQAILMYLAKKSSFYPSDEVVAAKVDMVFGVALDLMGTINPLVNKFDYKTDDWKEKEKNYFELFPKQMTSVEKVLGKNPFLGGEGPSHADFALFHVVDASLLVRSDSVSNHKRLLEWFGVMGELKGLKQYLQTRPKTSQVGMGPSYIRNLPE